MTELERCTRRLAEEVMGLKVFGGHIGDKIGVYYGDDPLPTIFSPFTDANDAVKVMEKQGIETGPEWYPTRNMWLGGLRGSFKIWTRSFHVAAVGPILLALGESEETLRKIEQEIGGGK